MVLNCGVGEDSWVPWTARRSKQSILKEVNPKYSLEGVVLKLKLQYFGHLMQITYLLEKTLMLGKIEDRRRRGQKRVRWLDSIIHLPLYTKSAGWKAHTHLITKPRLSYLVGMTDYKKTFSYTWGSASFSGIGPKWLSIRFFRDDLREWNHDDACS